MEPTLTHWNEGQTIAKSKITSRASVRILERYPIEESDVNSLFDAEEMAGGDPEALYNLSRLLLKLWKFVIFFQPKPEALIDLLRGANYPDAVVKGILDAYSSNAFSAVSESLASCSFSGIPRVFSTDWTSRTIVARNNQSSSDREAVLTLTTNQGAREVVLSQQELEKLYWAVNKVQASLDDLLES
ncbi:unnamed protein product [Caenorhabditis sp. 36 PRJEB53466]|nr:unnamed protein product [Caenorhabditis sp. 36 PRJEB53466]